MVAEGIPVLFVDGGFLQRFDRFGGDEIMGGDDLAHGFLIEVDSLQRLIVIAVERHITENERLVMNRIFGLRS